MKDRAVQKTLDELEKLYGIIAPHFSQTRAHTWPELTEMVDSVQPGERVLDIGCGNGRLYDLLGAKKVKYVGIDSSVRLLAEAKRLHPEVTFIHDRMETLERVDGLFDQIFMIASLHHLPSHTVRLAALQAAQDHLRAGGAFSITVWNLFQPKYRSLVRASRWHAFIPPFTRQAGDVFVPWKDETGKLIGKRYYYAFTAEGLQALLEEAGFIVEKIWYTKDRIEADQATANNLCAFARKRGVVVME